MNEVTLSGADLGGTIVDGTGWEIGTLKEIDGFLYRRDFDTEATFVGMA